MSKEAAFWEKMAPRYDAQSARYMDTAYPLTIAAAKRAISPDDTVIDIGCGTGIVTLAIASSTAHIVGVDIAAAMIDVAKQKAEDQGITNVAFHIGDTTDQPSLGFDVVLLCNLLHYVTDPAAQLQEAYRLLKPGGTLISVTDCLGEPAGLGVALLRWGSKLLGLLGILPKMQAFSKSDLAYLTKENGFTIVEDGDFYAKPINYYIKSLKRTA